MTYLFLSTARNVWQQWRRTKLLFGVHMLSKDERIQHPESWQFWRKSFYSFFHLFHDTHTVWRTYLGNIVEELMILASQLVWESSGTWMTLVFQEVHEVPFPWWISLKSMFDMFVRLSWWITDYLPIVFSAPQMLPTSLSGLAASLAHSGSFLHSLRPGMSVSHVSHSSSGGGRSFVWNIWNVLDCLLSLCSKGNMHIWNICVCVCMCVCVCVCVYIHYGHTYIICTGHVNSKKNTYII